MITGEELKAGDVLIGMASTGVHSNGFSLVRKVFEKEMTREGLETYYEELGGTLGDTLLAPTRIYVKALKAVKQAGVRVKACSHITGGGFYENVPRMLKDGVRAVIKKDSYPVPPIFPMMQKKGEIDETIMYNTFNMGIGMVVRRGRRGRRKGDGSDAVGRRYALCHRLHRGGRKGSDLMLKVGVLVSGGGTNLQAILDAIDNGTVTNAKVCMVLSNNPKAYALERAKKHGIPAECVSPKDFPDRAAFHAALLEKVDSYGLDLIVLAGFLVKVPEEMIRRYRNRIINIHPSLIPSFCGVGYYGLKVHEAALARGVKITGATVHFVDEGMDSGPILLQKAVEVHEGDTPERLQRRVMEEAEWKLLPMAIDLIANHKLEGSDGK